MTWEVGGSLSKGQFYDVSTKSRCMHELSGERFSAIGLEILEIGAKLETCVSDWNA